VAADSMGVRSMATVVETGDVKIGIDLWAALGPRRYGLPPHPLELQALEEARRLLAELGRSMDINIITHYHYDHFCPDCDFYANTRLLAKDWEENINRSQQLRFKKFKWGHIAQKADTLEVRIGDTKIEISPPFPHGERGTKLGYVVMVYVEENSGFLFTSDVQGPVEEKALNWIMEREPDLLYVDGPVTYLKGHKVRAEAVERAWENVEKLIDRVRTVVIDHHAARDLKFFEWVRERGLLTAGSYEGKERPLEARRRELWREGAQELKREKPP